MNRLGVSSKDANQNGYSFKNKFINRSPMNSKLPLIFLIMGLTACQQKSDIDKCVEAQAVQICNKPMGSDFEALYKVQGKSESDCVNNFIKLRGGNWQMECLKAQAGTSP